MSKYIIYYVLNIDDKYIQIMTYAILLIIKKHKIINHIILNDKDYEIQQLKLKYLSINE